jgi:hypothetical protein
MKILKSGAATALAWAWLIPPAAFGAATAVDYYQWALHCFQQKNYAEAGKYFHYALQVDPKDWKSLQMLGTCEALGGQAEEALEDYRKSLQINPSNPALVQYLKSFETAGSPEQDKTAVGSGPETEALSPGTAYVWDPAQDPYPRFTGPADPLPQPKIPLVPSVYLTASYGIGTLILASLETNGGGNPSYSPGILSLGLHFQPDPLVSIVLGTEIWPALKNSSSFTSYDYLDSSTYTFNITPVSLGIILHSWGNGISFDFGPSLAAFFYQNQISSNEVTYPNPGESRADSNQNTLDGTEFGFILQMDLMVEILPKNQLDLFLTGKGYLDTGIGFIFNGTATSSEINTNPPAAPVTTTETFNDIHYGSNDGPGVVGATLGIGLQGGF